MPVYYDTCVKPKIRTYDDKGYTNFCGLNVPEDEIEYTSCSIISIDSFPVYENRYYLQVLSIMTDYLDDNLFETVEDYFL